MKGAPPVSSWICWVVALLGLTLDLVIDAVDGYLAGGVSTVVHSGVRWFALMVFVAGCAVASTTMLIDKFGRSVVFVHGRPERQHRVQDVAHDVPHDVQPGTESAFSAYLAARDDLRRELEDGG